MISLDGKSVSESPWCLHPGRTLLSHLPTDSIWMERQRLSPFQRGI